MPVGIFIDVTFNGSCSGSKMGDPSRIFQQRAGSGGGGFDGEAGGACGCNLGRVLHGNVGAGLDVDALGEYVEKDKIQ